MRFAGEIFAADLQPGRWNTAEFFDATKPSWTSWPVSRHGFHASGRDCRRRFLGPATIHLRVVSVLLPVVSVFRRNPLVPDDQQVLILSVLIRELARPDAQPRASHHFAGDRPTDARGKEGILTPETHPLT